MWLVPDGSAASARSTDLSYQWQSKRQSHGRPGHWRQWKK